MFSAEIECFEEQRENKSRNLRRSDYALHSNEKPSNYRVDNETRDSKNQSFKEDATNKDEIDVYYKYVKYYRQHEKVTFIPGADSGVTEPVLSQEALLNSMKSALATLEESKRGKLTPEKIAQFLDMLYNSYFEDTPTAMEEKIKNFIGSNVSEEVES